METEAQRDNVICYSLISQIIRDRAGSKPTSPHLSSFFLTKKKKKKSQNLSPISLWLFVQITPSWGQLLAHDSWATKCFCYCFVFNGYHLWCKETLVVSLKEFTVYTRTNASCMLVREQVTTKTFVLNSPTGFQKRKTWGLEESGQVAGEMDRPGLQSQLSFFLLSELGQVSMHTWAFVSSFMRIISSFSLFWIVVNGESGNARCWVGTNQ